MHKHFWFDLKGKIFFFYESSEKRNQKEVCDQGEEIRVDERHESPLF